MRKEEIQESIKYEWSKQEEEGRRLNEVRGVKREAGSRDKIKHIKRNDQLFAEKMMQVDKWEW